MACLVAWNWVQYGMAALYVIDLVAQVIILLVCPVAFVGLGSGSARVRHWSCTVALASQALWLFTQFYHEQYLIVPVSVIYAWGWWKQLSLNP